MKYVSYYSMAFPFIQTDQETKAKSCKFSIKTKDLSIVYDLVLPLHVLIFHVWVSEVTNHKNLNV